MTLTVAKFSSKCIFVVRVGIEGVDAAGWDVDCFGGF